MFWKILDSRILAEQNHINMARKQLDDWLSVAFPRRTKTIEREGTFQRFHDGSPGLTYFRLVKAPRRLSRSRSTIFDFVGV